MASTQLPVTVPNVHPIVNNWIAFIKAHEFIIIVALLLGSALFVAQKYFDLSAAIENHRAQQATASLTAQTNTTNAEITQVKQSLVAYQDALVKSAAQNTQLQKVIDQRNSALTNQQKADTLLSSSNLATRWISQVGDNGIAATTAGFDVSNTAAIATVQTLEQVPVLKQDLKDEQSKEVNLQTDITAANDLVSKGKETAASMALEMQDKDKVCSAQLAVVKADARKSKLKTFFTGVVVGFIGGLLAHGI